MPLPSSLIAGDSLSVTVDGGEYSSANGWAATLRLVPRGSGSAVAITGTASGTAWAFAANSAATAAYTAGDYSAAVYATKAGDRKTLAAGLLTVTPNPAAIVAGTDTRSQAEIALAAAKAALASWTPTKRRYTIGDVAMEFNSTAEILEVIHFWTGQVEQERRATAAAAGLYNPGKVYVRAGRV